MINKRVEEAINSQINAELYSAYLYLSMASYFEENDLPGFANWMRIQFQEEQAHAFGFYDYLTERGGRVVLEAIEKPPHNWSSMIEVFEETLKHEQHVTSLINNIQAIAFEEKDFATTSFNQWFINEQVEEESTASNLLAQLKRVNGEGHAVLMLDRELGARTFNPPTIG